MKIKDKCQEDVEQGDKGKLEKICGLRHRR